MSYLVTPKRGVFGKIVRGYPRSVIRSHSLSCERFYSIALKHKQLKHCFSTCAICFFLEKRKKEKNIKSSKMRICISENEIYSILKTAYSIHFQYVSNTFYDIQIYSILKTTMKARIYSLVCNIIYQLSMRKLCCSSHTNICRYND